MLKIAIENSYHMKYSGSDEFGARLFMQNIFLQHNMKLVRVSINTFDIKKNRFNEYNILDVTGKNKIIQKPFEPDIIRSRRGVANKHKYELLHKFIVVPSEKVSILSNDKFENFKFSEKYQPFTSLLSQLFTNTKMLKRFSHRVVLKPIRANGGKGIILITIPELLKKRKKYEGLEELYIVQQFKDFSKGYPGICSTNHDVRFMFAGNKIIEITLRIPKKGDFRSNLGSGGTQHNLDKSQIPNELLLLSKRIYHDLNLDGKNIFSMDFAYCKKDKKRYFLEINASPGTWYYQTDKSKLKKICLGLISFFKKIV